jgi:hypothetical protein
MLAVELPKFEQLPLPLVGVPFSSVFVQTYLLVPQPVMVVTGAVPPSSVRLIGFVSGLLVSLLQLAATVTPSTRT